MIVLTLLVCMTTCFGGVIKDSGVKGGIVVQLGVDSGKDLVKLLANEKYLVQGLERDVDKVVKARKSLKSMGLYGKVTVNALDGDTLPYADNTVNLVIMRDAGYGMRDGEIDRVLVPGGILMADKKKKEFVGLEPLTIQPCGAGVSLFRLRSTIGRIIFMVRITML